MSDVLNVFQNLYRTPTEDVLQHRKTFYLLTREITESLAEWFCRIRNAVEYCDFGEFGNFLVIDKFFCELDDDVKWLQKTNTWSVDQLFQAIVETKDTDMIAEPRLGTDNFPKIEVEDVESAASFFNSNTDHSDKSDNDENSRLPDFVKCDPADIEVLPVINSIETPRLAKQKVETEKSKKNNEKDAENRYHCLECGKNFKQKTMYNQHQKLHSGKNLFHCTICNKVFLKPSKLKNHFQKHEREQSSAGKTFQCHLCKFQFLRIQGLRIHINVKHVTSIKNEFQCEHCNGVFAHQPALDDHLRSQHQMNIPHKCPHCTREFQQDQMNQLKEHLTTHSENKPFMCEVCASAFRTRKQLDMHMVRHTNERRFRCAECGQMLKSRSNYKTHMRKHTGERPFSCSFCDKTFVQRANYLKHTRWHTGDKPHSCTWPNCVKRFPTNYDLKLHVNSIHTGEKPFSCDLCDQKFSQPSTLRVHRLRMHR